jgi:serine/threonine protein kinase
MAEVFLARQEGLKGFEKYVVVKKILNGYAESADFIEMLFAEARANARLTHPNIVQTYDVGVMDGVAYITLEYVRGPDLRRLLTELRKAHLWLPLAHALRITADTASALHYAHSYVDPTGLPHPVVHRDVSPQNILVSLDGSVKLSDFGIAKVQGEAGYTKPGVLKGKISYCSPEAIREQPLDARNDVFSLGVVLFELVTGQLPFKRGTDVATLRAVLADPPPIPCDVSPTLPRDVSALVLRALEKQPQDRFRSANEMREEVEAAMVRHGLRSSATSISSFFLESLGERLAEFVPNVSQRGISAEVSAPPEGRRRTQEFESAGDLNIVVEISEVSVSTAEVKAPTVSEHPLRTYRPLLPPVFPEPKPAWRHRWPYALMALLLLGAASAVAVRRTNADQIAVTNLGSGDHLYIEGVQHNPDALHLPGKQWLVAVSHGGRLVRFGQATREQGIDANSLVEASNALRQDAVLHVTSPGSGCQARLDGHDAPRAVPMRMPLEAGREVELELICPSGTPRHQTLLALPGQTVEVTAADVP